MVQLSIVQFTPVWGDKSQNFQKITSLLDGLETDIVVLPELCTTGYSFLTRAEAFAAAEDQNNDSFNFFKAQAAKLNAVIIAGFAERDGDNAYNSALIVFPDGDSKIYRKTHLFFKEKLCFEPGNSGFFVFDHPNADCRIGVMICNDWRFPEAARTLALQGADVIACPSNLVTALWGVGMPGRALENKVYLAVTNRCGIEKRRLEDGSEQVLTFNGASVIYDFNGAPMVQASLENEGVFTVQIDPTLTRDKAYNAYNNVIADRRPDLYKLK